MDKVNFKSFFPGTGATAETPANTTGKAINADEGTITQTDVENSIENLFDAGEEYASEASPHPFSMQIGDPSDPGYSVDPVTGKKTKDYKANPYYVPTLEDIEYAMKLQGIPLSFDVIDKTENLYKEAVANTNSAIDYLEKQLKINANKPKAIKYLKKLMSLAKEALGVANDALDRLPKWKKELEQNYKDEYAEFQKIAANCYEDFNTGDLAKKKDIIINKFKTADRNNDGWIGEPGKGLEIFEKEGGLRDGETKITITNISSSGIPSTSRWFDPSATWNVAKDGVKMSDKKIGDEDLTLEADGSDITEDKNTLSAKFDVSIPDYIVVKSDEDGVPKEKDISADDSDRHYIPAKFSVDNGQIKQVVPDTLDGYAQVFVSRVEIDSDDENKDGNGYDYRLKFYDKSNAVIAEIRITARGQERPASDYGLAINGNNRKNPVSVDATELRTTGKQVISELWQKKILDEYGVDFSKLSDPARGRDVFENQMANWGGAVETDLGDKSAKNTGIMSYGLSGYIQGALKGNNFVCFKEPDGQSSAPREGKVEDDNPFYKNVFTGGDTYNAVFTAGKGDIYASGVTLGWNDAKDHHAISAFSINNEIKNEEGKIVNVEVFAALMGNNGKNKLIDNEPDGDTSNPKDVVENKGDDYFDTEGVGSYSVTNSGGDSDAGDPDADSDIAKAGALDEIVCDDIGMKIEDALNDMDIEEEDPLKDSEGNSVIGGDYYASTYDSSGTFFEDIGAWFGFKNEKMEAFYDETDDSNEEKI